jgi:hypothetical protein
MTDESTHSAEDLLIAVYLDTNALLDLLATVEDGFTFVERVTTGQTAGTTSERSASGEVSSPGILSFFKVGLSGKLGRTRSQGSSDSSEAELTHTYGSLLNRLRRYLVTEELVAPGTADQGHQFKVGEFVEFSGVVRPNPFTASFERLQRMLGFAEIAFALEGKQQPSQAVSRGGGKGQNQQRKPVQNPQQREFEAMAKFVDQITKDVEREGTNTLVIEQSDGSYSAVLTLFETYLRDRSMSELLNREFRVLGKVARHLPEGSQEKVDLLASSGIAGFPPDVLRGLTEAISAMSGSGSAQVAAPSTTIEPPAIEIVPIAIYL